MEVHDLGQQLTVGGVVIEDVKSKELAIRLDVGVESRSVISGSGSKEG